MNGARPHQPRAGEEFHATSGERCGLWRNHGRAPQRLTGVGFAAQGFDRSTYYERLPDSFDERAAFVFEGVGDDERIGDFGIMGGGAGGAEIDRFDTGLGSPPGALLLASTVGLSRRLPAHLGGDLRDPTGTRAGRRTPMCGPTLSTSRSEAEAPSSRPAPSPGRAACPTTATTTMSAGSRATCCGGSSREEALP